MDKTKDYTITITVTVRQAKDYWYTSPKGEAELSLTMPGNVLENAKSKSAFPINVSFEDLVLSSMDKLEKALEEEKTDENNSNST